MRWPRRFCFGPGPSTIRESLFYERVMTDESPWRAPGEPAPGPTQPAGPLPAPSPYSAVSPLPAAVWSPPPKPGLIPLRPLDLGTLLGAAFRVLRRNPRPTLGTSLVLQSASLLASLLLVGGVTFASISRLSTATAEDQAAIAAGTVSFAVISALLTIFISLIAQALLQGIIVVEVARGTLGEKLRLRGLWAFAKGRIWALVGWATIIAAVLLVAIGIIVGFIIMLVAVMGAMGVVLGVLAGIFGALALVALGVWLGTKLSLVPSALVLERLALFAAMKRSWSLTAGSFWRVFGIQLLVWFIVGVAANVAVLPFSVVAPLLLALIDPNGTNAPLVLVIAGAVYILQLVVSVVVGAITSIISTATSALIYLDLRMRREGLDLELNRFVEARQAGTAGAANPYLRPDPQVDATEPLRA